MLLVFNMKIFVENINNYFFLSKKKIVIHIRIYNGFEKPFSFQQIIHIHFDY